MCADGAESACDCLHNSVDDTVSMGNGGRANFNFVRSLAKRAAAISVATASKFHSSMKAFGYQRQ